MSFQGPLFNRLRSVTWDCRILAPGVAHASFTLQPTVGLEMQIYEERWLHRTFISAFLGLLSPDSVFEHHPVRTVRVMMRFLKLFQWVYSERELDGESLVLRISYETDGVGL